MDKENIIDKRIVLTELLRENMPLIIIFAAGMWLGYSLCYLSSPLINECTYTTRRGDTYTGSCEETKRIMYMDKGVSYNLPDAGDIVYMEQYTTSTTLENTEYIEFNINPGNGSCPEPKIIEVPSLDCPVARIIPNLPDGLECETCEVCLTCPECECKNPTTPPMRCEKGHVIIDTQIHTSLNSRPKTGSAGYQAGWFDGKDYFLELFQIPGRPKFKSRTSSSNLKQLSGVALVKRDVEKMHCFPLDTHQHFRLNGTLWSWNELEDDRRYTNLEVYRK